MSIYYQVNNKPLRRPVELGQYTSIDYTQTLDDHRVLASVGSVGDAYDNALAESFVDSFKTELIADRAWQSRSQPERAETTTISARRRLSCSTSTRSAARSTPASLPDPPPSRSARPPGSLHETAAASTTPKEPLRSPPRAPKPTKTVPAEPGPAQPRSVEEIGQRPPLNGVRTSSH